jgi:hypothetical protein
MKGRLVGHQNQEEDLRASFNCAVAPQTNGVTTRMQVMAMMMRTLGHWSRAQNRRGWLDGEVALRGTGMEKRLRLTARRRRTVRQ